MKKVYGYIRVSTVKQGTGVSLQEQKEAIIRYAEKHQLNVIEWFEEKETAAKQGRPLFNKMMKQLKDRKACGVIFHKIDRGSRNYKDWAAIDELITSGIELHFAHESLDMNTRAGRLTADMLQALATDYIRNLREEATKGLYGRLKQGIYPFGAPVGYINNGKGNLKTIDEIKAPLIKKAFELYATGKHGLHSLGDELIKCGLRNSNGKKMSIQSLSNILNNPFYTGILKVKGKAFQGKHQPLISAKLFKDVQDVLNGKTQLRNIKHDFVYRKLINCSGCGYSLTGETRKGHVYYRCHTKNCLTKSIREELITIEVNQSLSRLRLDEIEAETLNEYLTEAQNDWNSTQKSLIDSQKMLKVRLENKFQRLTDAYIEGVIDKDQFEQKKESLMLEQQDLNSNEYNFEDKLNAIFRKAKNFFGLLKSLNNIDLFTTNDEKRKLLKIISSDISISRKKLMITMPSPFFELANRESFNHCEHSCNTSRTKIANLATSESASINYNTEPHKSIIKNHIIPDYDCCSKFKDQMKSLFDLVLSYCQSVDTDVLNIEEDKML